MSIFKPYEKILNAAGFSISEETVRDAMGNSVAGVGGYGDVWYKSEAVETIVSSPAPKPKKDKAKSKDVELVRARTPSGHFIADDPSTPDVNESLVVKTVKKVKGKK